MWIQRHTNPEESGIDIQEAFETAQSMDLASKEDIRDVIGTRDESVNKVDKVATPRRQQGQSGSGFRCGQKHAPSECWCKTAQSYRCKKKSILPKCAIRNVMPTARVMLRMFRSQIVLMMKCGVLGYILSPLQISVDRLSSLVVVGGKTSQNGSRYWIRCVYCF